MLTLAIQPDNQLLMSGRKQSFSTRWIARAEAAGMSVRLTDVYDTDLRSQLSGCDAFLWWFAHLPEHRQAATRIVQAIAHGLRIPTFPNWETIWHFDDKVAQKYLLDAAAIPTPRTHVFWQEGAARAFAQQAQYPIVVKLTGGIGSENVRKVTSRDEAGFWITRLFGTGITALKGWPRPSTTGRATQRVKAAYHALAGRSMIPTSHRTELQRGYILCQEFLPGNEFDTRVTVIGERAFAFRRFNRLADFRASGSGRIDWDPAGIDPDAVRLAFEVARCLRTQSLAVDVLKAPGGSLAINEISYYYEGWAVEACPGHWRPGASWHPGHVAPEDAIFDDFVAGWRSMVA